MNKLQNFSFRLKRFRIFKPWIFPLIFFITIGLVVYWKIPNLSETVFDLTGLARILTVFVIANSLFSLIFPFTLKRVSLKDRRESLIVSLFSLWLAVFLVLLEIIRGQPYFLSFLVDIPNPFTRFAVILWGFGVFYLLKTTYATLTIDNIQFQKKELNFEQKNEKKWGFESINSKLNESDKDIFFPMIVLADETTRPWKILLRFILAGLSYTSFNPGGIYFTFTRPASEIRKMLKTEYDRMKETDPERKILGSSVSFDNLVFIDCYSLEAERELWNDADDELKQSNIFYADSFDPHEINRKYETALNKLKEKGCKNIRVVYDAISDFLTFTDFQIAVQYLRHNMGFEQRRKVQSLYLLRMGTMEKEKEEYFLWFANGVLQMKQEKINEQKIIQAEFRGPFRTPKTFMMNYDYSVYPSNPPSADDDSRE